MSFPSIRIEGQIFSGELLEKLDRSDTTGQRPADFGLPADVKVKDEIARAWSASQSYYRAFRQKTANSESRMANGQASSSHSPFTTHHSLSLASETRNLWLVPFLSLLGYSPAFSRRGEEVNGKLFPISHRDETRDGLPLHLLGWNDSLDKRRGDGSGPRMSPHALVQEYLNLTEHLYALVSNGKVIRLLRDSTRLVRQSFIEFDLERMFEEDLFADFAVLFRLLHATRLPAKQADVTASLIEKYHQDALDQGARIRDGLSKAVEKAILGFANGFLRHPANDALRAAILARTLPPETCYNHLLRLIYRFLFLFVIEERRLIFPPNVPARKRDIYYRHYSLQRIRRLASHHHLVDRHQQDLWFSILTTFRLFEADSPGPKLDIAPLAGDLFSPEAIGLLGQCALDNGTVLDVLRALSLYHHPDTHQLIRVNYASLNVEEFGSVYEGLLEYDPVFIGDTNPTFAFKQGDERSVTGSHFSPDELVTPLIRHSLDYIIAEKLEEGKRMASGEWRMVTEPYRKEFINYASQRLSRSGSVEKGAEHRQSGVYVDQELSQGGIVRDDLAASAGGGLHPSEHRGGMGPTLSGGVHPVSSDSQWQPGGAGNPSDHQLGRGVVQCGSHTTPPDGIDHTGQAIAFPRTKHPTEAEIASVWKSTPFAIRYSLFASQALLRLRVADISCGSGHILLAAARRIGTELAIVRTGEEQPSPEAFRAAVRDVIRECIYGVDLNPLAVELCKVALWLEAHIPGQPLNFLDHHIKCGNAIVGYARREEVERGVPDEAFKTLPGDDKKIASDLRKRNKAERLDHQRRQQQLNFSPVADEQLAHVLQHWREIAGLPEKTPDQIAAKKKRYEEFVSTTDAFLLKQILAIPIAQFYLPKTDPKKLITDAEFRLYWTGQRTPQGQATAVAWAMAHQKRFFHWFLEFPEIFQSLENDPAKSSNHWKPGFDLILGNPPYLGGQALSGTYGHAFCEYVKWEYAPAGLSDLVAYFVRRIYTLLRPGGFTAFITTNSIKDGDIRKDGLEQVIAQGGSINMAVRGIKWPGQAKLVVSLVAMHKGDWKGIYSLDGQNVTTINAYFEDAQISGEPENLLENENHVFQGSIFLGDGFLLTHEEADRLRSADPKNADVLYPIINGQELNNQPDQKPGRSIINFHDWTMDKAQRYTEPFKIIETLVKPFRATQNRQRNRDYWWNYAEHRPGLNRGLRPIKRCFGAAATTKYLNFSAAPTNQVFLNTIYVFTTDRWDLYAVVQSTIHEVWARKYSGALKQDLRYSPSKCFDTYPFPAGLWEANSELLMANGEESPNHSPLAIHHSLALRAIGERYHEHRRALMKSLWLGLTDIYNLFHAPDLTPEKVAKVSKKPLDEARIGYEAIQELRLLHIELDQTVLNAYGWPDLPLGHDFVAVETLPENDRTRYTITPEARKELLTRLLAENHKRAAEEAVNSVAPKIRVRSCPSKKQQGELF